MRASITLAAAFCFVVAHPVHAGGPLPDAPLPGASKILFDQVGGVASTHVLIRVRPGVTATPAGGLSAVGADADELQTVLETFDVVSIVPAGTVEPADAERAARFGLDRFYRVVVPAGTDTPALRAALAGAPDLIELAELDGIGGLASTPDDPSLPLQYGVQNTGQVIDGSVGTPGADVNAIAAWAFETGAEDDDLVIAVLDSGAFAHPELGDKILPGWNVPLGTADTTDVCSSHGTHVSGIAAAIGDNGVGVAGMHWGAKIMPVVVVDPCSGPESYVADGLIVAADAGVDIINMSLQYSAGTEYLHAAVQYAADSGAVLVAASGNSNGDVAYPAKWPETIAVAATDNQDERYVLSNFGPEIDVAAPGVDVYSLSGSAFFAFKTGTSMATPYVSGTAALLLSIDPSLDAADVRSILRETADDVSLPGVDVFTGHGRIDAGAAVSSIAPEPPVGDLDGNGVVDGADLGLMLGAWGSCADCELIPCPEDLTFDCVVDGADLGLLLANWG